MADEIKLSEHLHKLIRVKSEQKLEDLLQLLWQTRKTGLSNSQKSSIHSLLYLPSPKADEALKLLPADLPLELQSMLLVLLQKHPSHWKGELSLELQHASGLSRSSHQGVLPQVKSMTWTVENKGEIPTNRVAIITLKLHDHTKSPINEMEVKFQLTRDTLEAVLRSMSYISQQLSQFVRSSTKPLHKKQRQ